MTATASAHPPGPHRSPARAWLLLPFVLILFALPPLMFGRGSGELIDDTRAYFGAGTAKDVPIVTSVDCVASRAGSNSSRGLGMTTYGCVIDVSPPTPPATDDPFKTLPYDQAMAEWYRRTQAEIKRVTDPANALHRIERNLPSNRTGTTPILRRLSPDGAPKRFGVVWGPGELAWRWSGILLFTAMFWGLAIGILILARRFWRGPGQAVAPETAQQPAPTLNDNHPSA